MKPMIQEVTGMACMPVRIIRICFIDCQPQKRRSQLCEVLISLLIARNNHDALIGRKQKKLGGAFLPCFTGCGLPRRMADKHERLHRTHGEAHKQRARGRV